MGNQWVLHIPSMSVAVVIQHAMRMRSIVFSCGLSGCTIFFRIISKNGTIFGEGLLNITCVLIFCTASIWSISQFKNSSRFYHKLRRSSCKVTVVLAKILMKLEFSRYFFSKNPQIPNFMKIRPVGAELFHADGRTDRDRHDIAYSRFSQLCERA